MPRRRSHVDACAAAHALEIVGERWALLVVRELLLGPKRFTDLRAGIPDVSPDVLGRRLRELEHSGVVLRRTLPPPASARVYELTGWGYELEPVVMALGRWGSRSATAPRHGELSVDALALALTAEFDPDAAAGVRARYALRLGEHRFRVDIADGAITLARGTGDMPDAAIETDPTTLAALLWGGRGLDGALRDGDIAISGDRTLVVRFLSLFPLAERVAPTGPAGDPS